VLSIRRVYNARFQLETVLVRHAVGIIFCIVGLVGCGTKTAAGESCTATPSGAAECESGICLQGLQCTTGEPIPTACAGSDCTQSKICGSDLQCWPISSNGQSFCLPTTLCSHD